MENPIILDGILHSSADEIIRFMRNILDSSTEYSIIGNDLDGNILLWNEGARRIYGYEAKDVVGKKNSEIIHIPEDIEAGLPQKILEETKINSKWTGILRSERKDKSHFTANVTITTRNGANNEIIGFLIISKDISNEIRLTEEIKETQFYTRSLIESNIDALMTTDSLGIISDVNKQMEKLTGKSRDSLIGTPFKHYFTDQKRAEEAILHVLQEGTVSNYELTICAQNGSETTVSYNASAYRDTEGRLKGVFAAARDITELKILEEQLLESHLYNRGLIEASVDGLIIIDTNDNISDVNGQMCQMSGYSREALIGTSFSSYFEDSNQALDVVNHTSEKGKVTNYELTLKTCNEIRLRISFNASVFKSADGHVRGIFGSSRDITEQFRLQNQLSEERAYNRGLIETSLEGLITVDPMLRIVDVNKTMCQITGYDRDELVGSLFPDYFTDRKEATSGVRTTLDKGMVTNYELTLKTKSGIKTSVSFNAAIFKDEKGKIRGIFASARDIKDQKKLQEQLNEEQAYNRSLIEAFADVSVTIDEDMRITDVNDTMGRIVGKSRKQLINSLFPEYFTDVISASECVKLTFKEGAIQNFVLELQVPNGVSIPVSINAAIIKDTNGKVRGIFASVRDITDQRYLESQLRKSQVHAKSLIEANIDALATMNPLGVITDINHQMEALTGYTRSELIGSPFKNYFTDPKLAEEGIRLVLQFGKFTNYELTTISKSGVKTIVSYNATTFLDTEGNLQGVFASARDITEQKDLEGRLRDQQTYLRGQIDSSVDGLVAMDPKGIITDVNKTICRMSGYSRNELLGTPFSDYFTEHEKATIGIQETIRNGSVTEYALTLIARGRRFLNVSFNASIFKGQEGEIRGIFASARDVTDRARLEEQMRDQQTYLRGLIEASIDGLIIVDPDGYITDLNEQMCRMTEYERDVLIGSSFKKYFTEQNKADSGVRQTFAEGNVSNYELVLITKSGRKYNVSVNASVFRDALHNIQGIIASTRDIHEQHRLQTQLAEEQAYNRSLFEASADALFAIAPDGKITDINEEATRLTAYTKSHLINSKFAQYFTDPKLAEQGVIQTLNAGRVMGYELLLKTRHDRLVAVSFNAGIYFDASGNPQGILVAARDITQQKELDQKLRDQQAYSTSLIESNVDALMTTDPLGVISDVNKQMEKLTGVTREDLIGTPFKIYFTEPFRAEEGIKKVLFEGKVNNYELMAKNISGVETLVSYNAAVYNNREGKLQGVFISARDITERKLFEETLNEKNIELERASLAKDRFLATMSHELRTPLNAIIGFTGTLLMKLPGPITDKQEYQLKTIETSAKHLLSLINDLLNLAKIESGKIEFNFEKVNCKDVLEEVYHTLKALAEEKSITLNLEITPELENQYLTTDHRSLTQILINLTNNAIKFTNKGKIRITFSNDSNDINHVCFHVIDSGIGIGESDSNKLFEAFKQVGTRSSLRAEGTGLGLHLSKKLANLLGGQINFKSHLGEGSDFWLIMPLISPDSNNRVIGAV
jgi:PAS domain S-box-containing protein